MARLRASRRLLASALALRRPLLLAHTLRIATIIAIAASSRLSRVAVLTIQALHHRVEASVALALAVVASLVEDTLVAVVATLEAEGK